MAKAKPVKQKKENKFWEGLKFWLKSLISNDICVAAKNKKWFWAVIIAVLSAIIGTIPTMVSRFTVSASTFFSSGLSYGYDVSLVKLNDALETSGTTMTINEGKLTINGWENLVNDPLAGTNRFWCYLYKDTSVKVSTNTAEDGTTSDSLNVSEIQYCGLCVYASGETSATTFATSILAKAENDPNYTLNNPDLTGYSTNFIVIGNNDLYIAKGVSKGSVTSGISIKYDHADFQGKDLVTLIKATENKTALNSWATLLDKGYQSTKVRMGWQYTGISFGINAGIIVIMGLVIFLTTRGKSNPFKILSVWDCQKICYWAAFTPSLISLFGLISAFSSYAMFIFPLMFIMRSTWMSMRSLKPQYQ